LVTDIKVYIYISQTPVSNTCNPSYSRSRDQEDDGSKPVWANNLRDPISKALHKNRAGRAAQGEGPRFKHQY
jgi:hypothetical protein